MEGVGTKPPGRKTRVFFPECSAISSPGTPAKSVTEEVDEFRISRIQNCILN
jgi:hypothetical protein